MAEEVIDLIQEILSQNGTYPEAHVIALPLNKLLELDEELQTAPRDGLWARLRRAANEAIEAHWRVQRMLREAVSCPMC